MTLREEKHMKATLILLSAWRHFSDHRKGRGVKKRTQVSLRGSNRGQSLGLLRLLESEAEGWGRQSISEESRLFGGRVTGLTGMDISPSSDSHEPRSSFGDKGRSMIHISRTGITEMK